MFVLMFVVFCQFLALVLERQFEVDLIGSGKIDIKQIIRTTVESSSAIKAPKIIMTS